MTAPVTDVRSAGTLGIVGGFSYFAAGARMLFFGAHQDRLTDALAIVWALCWVAAGLAMLKLRVTGRSIAARAVSLTLIVGFSAAALWGVHRLIDPPAAARGPLSIAPLIVVLGMIGTGALSLSAAPWRDWRRALPMCIAVVYVTMIVINGITSTVTLPYAFTIAGLGYVLLGAAIRSTPAVS
jgi:hypothetical protein